MKLIEYLFFFCIASVIFLSMMYSVYEAQKEYYTMPDGVECETEILTGGWGKATHEFKDCSNGKTYINPETYGTGKRE